jgi:hypothetical protein
LATRWPSRDEADDLGSVAETRSPPGHCMESEESIVICSRERSQLHSPKQKKSTRTCKCAIRMPNTKLISIVTKCLIFYYYYNHGAATLHRCSRNCPLRPYHAHRLSISILISTRHRPLRRNDHVSQHRLL